ncbi:hypothetical protein M2322_000810 [Rhodoblastus acidophilus]|uniref:hypothetical protein n=1 Tax=Rhodoblastus acidophilus TaxID=1074 RepID=UPI002225A088|nr:hypothetical protein [Rhodoblastus acidophilus]MCW2315276.1 hypothetical protein [Rhodoblastus acidophilus]
MFIPGWRDELSEITALKAARDAAIAERDALAADAARYRFLRSRDLETIDRGGVFAGLTPKNVVLNGEDLDREVDAAICAASKESRADGGGNV